MSILHRQRSSVFRFTAALGVAMVVWLNLLVASPGLHAWLHHHDGSECGVAEAHGTAAGGDHHHHAEPVGSPDHHCAATLFAGGVEALLVLSLRLLPCPPVCCGLLRPEGAGRRCALPRYWHVPALGPPVV